MVKVPMDMHNTGHTTHGTVSHGHTSHGSATHHAAGYHGNVVHHRSNIVKQKVGKMMCHGDLNPSCEDNHLIFIVLLCNATTCILLVL